MRLAANISRPLPREHSESRPKQLHRPSDDVLQKKSGPLVQSLRIAIRDAASKRPRFGWRRILVLVRRDGHQVGETRLLRLYREEGLSLRQKSPKRRRSAVVRQPKSVAAARNEIWSMDFMHDWLSNGRKFRLLTVVDAFTRECIALEIAYGFKSMDVITALRRAIARRGKPQTLRCDNGSEFTSTEFDRANWWAWPRCAADFWQASASKNPGAVPKAGRRAEEPRLSVSTLAWL